LEHDFIKEKFLNCLHTIYRKCERHETDILPIILTLKNR